MSDSNSETESRSSSKAHKQPYWLIYLAMFISGLILLAHSMSFAPAQTLSSKLAIALIYSAFALCISGSRLTGIWASLIVWATVILSFFL